MYAIFENPGHLDIRSTTVMGLNSKPNSANPIGYFGTGFKYAIAVCARLGLNLEIQDGLGNTYRLITRKDKFRNKEFDFPMLEQSGGDPIQLPFTTELGKNWKPWTIVRELECNARDEGGSFHIERVCKPSQMGTVRIIVDGEFSDGTRMEDFAQFAQATRERIFFENLPGDVQKLRHVWEYKQTPTRAIFYRGILVHEQKGAQFAHTYNFIEPMMLTEDRTVQSTWEMNVRIEKFLLQEGPVSALRRVINDESCAEWQVCTFNWLDHTQWGAEHKAVVMEAYQKCHYLGEKLKEQCRDAKIEADSKKPRTLNEDECDMIGEALNLLRFGGYDIEADADLRIEYVDQLSGNALGRADVDEKVIYIASRNFTDGVECLACTLLEEFTHVRTGFRDETRPLQDHLLRQIIAQIKSHRRTFARSIRGEKENIHDRENTSRSKATRGPATRRNT